MENTQTEQNPQEQASKSEKKFSAAIQKLTAILNGSENLKPIKRLPNDELSSLVDELVKEEKEALYVDVKNKLKDLLKQYHELNKSIKAKEDELAKLVAQKKEEFAKAAQSLFDKIQNVDDVRASYYKGLEEAAS